MDEITNRNGHMALHTEHSTDLHEVEAAHLSMMLSGLVADNWTILWRGPNDNEAREYDVHEARIALRHEARGDNLKTTYRVSTSVFSGELENSLHVHRTE